MNLVEQRSILKRYHQEKLEALQQLADRIKVIEVSIKNLPESDSNGNLTAETGCDRCSCGCKYWEFDHCVSCGAKHQSLYNSHLINNQDTDQIV